MTAIKLSFELDYDRIAQEVNQNSGGVAKETAATVATWIDQNAKMVHRNLHDAIVGEIGGAYDDYENEEGE